MFDRQDKARCFALPPGCDFLACFLDGLQTKLLGHPPEAIAKVEIYLNTHRAARRLEALFKTALPGFMPTIKVITDLATEPLLGADIPTAISPLRRRLELSQTIATLLKATPELAPRTAIFDLADSLANLMDEMQGEGVHPAALAELDVADHAAHWGRSLTFLNILSAYFSDTSEPDAEARQRMVIEHLAQEWAKTPPSHPVIIAASTGSRGATARFMQLVAGLPQGAVVLPGFDFEQPDAVVKVLADNAKSSDHPQAGLIKLIGLLGLELSEVENWSNTGPPHPERNQLVSLAMRPAPVTDQWLVEGHKFTDLQETTESMSLLQAPSARHEANAIALRLRKAVEDGLKATLISPDRLLTRQVTAALERWNIEPDDSAGRPLPMTPPGVFLRLVSDLFGQRLTSDTLLILLKHPLTHSAGDARNTHLLRSRELELGVLRGGAPFPDFDQITDWADERKTDEESNVWADWLAACFAGLSDTTERHLVEHVAAHRQVAEMLAQGPTAPEHESELWLKPAGIEAARVFAELEENADAGGMMSPDEYAALFRSVFGRAEVRDPIAPHPDITIWGTLEARVQGADLVILGGLNDGVWPSLPDPDPWLSRPMRLQAGLLLPERRIGLSAHDFQQAIAANEVLLTRAIRDADAPTVASRWLIRLTNLLSGLGEDGETALSEMAARGQVWLDLARELEEPRQRLLPETRPSPRPPISARPNKLSVTQIKTLIRDPFAIYAKTVLRLRKLDPVRREPDALLRGQALHKVLEIFVQETIDGLPDNAVEQFLSVAERILEKEAPWPATRRLWLARLAKIADVFIEGEHKRREVAQNQGLEKKGRLKLSNPPFTLTGTADRIDRASDGSLIVYDYKTGSLPSKKQIALFDKQLPLEGAIAQGGGFIDIPPGPVSGLEYIGLGSDAKTQLVDINDDEINQAWEGLRVLIGAYQNRATGYTARARVEKRVDKSDYDHLSRFGEWEDTDQAVAKDVP